MAEARQAVLALGGNLGDRAATMQSAIEALRQHPKISAVRPSPFVESVALTEAGLDDSLPAYLNGVVLIETTLKPKRLLEVVREIESAHGRVRLERWSSRTLDIDIIAYQGELRSDKKLTIPHPRAAERAFVLVPWLMVDPKAVLPGYGPVAALAADMQDQVRPVA